MKKNKKKLVALVSSTALTLTSFAALSAACNSKPIFISKLQNTENKIFENKKDELRKGIEEAEKFVKENKSQISPTTVANLNTRIQDGKNALQNEVFLGGDFDAITQLIKGALESAKLSLSFAEDTSENRQKLQAIIEKLQKFITDKLGNEVEIKKTAEAILENAKEAKDNKSLRNIHLEQKINYIENNLNDWQAFLSAKDKKAVLLEELSKILDQAKASLKQFENNPNKAQFDSLAGDLQFQIKRASDVKNAGDKNSKENLAGTIRDLAEAKKQFDNSAKTLSDRIGTARGNLTTTITKVDEFITELGNNEAVQVIVRTLTSMNDVAKSALNNQNSTLATIESNNESLVNSLTNFKSIANNVKTANRNSLVENLRSIIDGIKSFRDTIPAANLDYKNVLNNLDTAISNAKNINNNTDATAEDLTKAIVDINEAYTTANEAKKVIDTNISNAKNDLNSAINVAKVLVQELNPSQHASTIKNLRDLIDIGERQYNSQDSSESQIDGTKNSLISENKKAQDEYNRYASALATTSRNNLSVALRDFKNNYINGIASIRELTPLTNIAQKIYDEQMAVYNSNPTGTPNNNYIFLQAKSIIDSFLEQTKSGLKYDLYKTLLITLQNTINTTHNLINDFDNDYESTFVNQSNFYNDLAIRNEYKGYIDELQATFDKYAVKENGKWVYKNLDDQVVLKQDLSDAISNLNNKSQIVSNFYDDKLATYRIKVDGVKGAWTNFKNKYDKVRKYAEQTDILNYDKFLIESSTNLPYKTYIKKYLEDNFKSTYVEGLTKEVYVAKLNDLTNWFDNIDNKQNVKSRIEKLMNERVSLVNSSLDAISEKYNSYLDTSNLKKLKRWIIDAGSTQMTSGTFKNQYDNAKTSYNNNYAFLNNAKSIYDVNNGSFNSSYNISSYKINNMVAETKNAIQNFKVSLDTHIKKYLEQLYKARYAGLALYTALADVDLNGTNYQIKTNGAWSYFKSIVDSMFPSDGAESLLKSYSVNNSNLLNYSTQYYHLIGGDDSYAIGYVSRYRSKSFSRNSIIGSTPTRDASASFYNPSINVVYSTQFNMGVYNSQSDLLNNLSYDPWYPVLSEAKWVFESWGNDVKVTIKNEYKLTWYDWNNNAKNIENIYWTL